MIPAAIASGRSASRTARCRRGRRAEDQRGDQELAGGGRSHAFHAASRIAPGAGLFPLNIGYHGRASMRGKTSFSSPGPRRRPARRGLLQSPSAPPAPEVPPRPGAAHRRVRLAGRAGRGQQPILPNTQVNDEMLLRVFLHLVEEQADSRTTRPASSPSSPSPTTGPPTKDAHLPPAQGRRVERRRAGDRRRRALSWIAQTNKDVAWNSPTRRAGSPTSRPWSRTPRASTSRASTPSSSTLNEGLIFPKHAWETLPCMEWRKNGDWFRQAPLMDARSPSPPGSRSSRSCCSATTATTRRGSPISTGGDAPGPRPGERLHPAC